MRGDERASPRAANLAHHRFVSHPRLTGVVTRTRQSGAKVLAVVAATVLLYSCSRRLTEANLYARSCKDVAHLLAAAASHESLRVRHSLTRHVVSDRYMIPQDADVSRDQHGIGCAWRCSAPAHFVR